MQYIDDYGRIFNNSHIDQPNNDLEQFLKSKPATEDIIKRLHLGDSSQYDADNSKDFSAKEISESKQSAANPVTIYSGKN